MERTTVYLATIPKRDSPQKCVLRIISIDARHVVCRLTALLPGVMRERDRTIRVDRRQFDLAVRVRMFRRITTLRCSCRSTMSIYNGEIGTRPAIFFACSGCEECLEI